MATATELSTKALKRIGVVNPSAEDVSDANDALNEMINSWKADGYEVTLPLNAKFDHGIIAMLSVRVAEDYGKEPGPILARDAANGLLQIQAAYLTVPASTFDFGLLPQNTLENPSETTLAYGGDTLITWS